MVVNSLLESAFNNPGNILSNDHATRLSLTTLLETFVPGYGPIHKYLLFAFGFDVTIFVSLGVVLWFGARIFRSVWAMASHLFHKNCMSEITIDGQDKIHDHIMAFLVDERKFKSSRRLTAETISKTALELDSEDIETKEVNIGDGQILNLLNFANQEAKSQPRFTPAFGSHAFWHMKRYFHLQRREITLYNEYSITDKELLTLSCLGRSAEPIKKLIQNATEHHYGRQKVTTVIMRPAPKDMRRPGGRGCWVKVAERPCRPMETIVLDKEMKMDVLGDINEYLHPKTALWYAIRGIPYRRGYLFYGPPGTGKTSFTFALGGHFGLDIYVTGLQSMSEEELAMQFMNLPPRCILLLEDIDTAGLVRESSENDEKTVPAAGAQSGINDSNVSNLAKALKKARQLSEEEKKRNITLSGLLNIIDGAASQEGRVLVMTTNHPEKLDEALIRPGRVDRQVEFKNASQKDAKEIFERMYTKDLQSTTTKEKNVPNPTANKTAKGAPITGAALNSVVEHGEEEQSSDELSQAAEKFAEQVPDGELSPAELQGFLLKRKKDPTKAVDDVRAWVDSRKEVKAKGSKLLQVQ